MTLVHFWASHLHELGVLAAQHVLMVIVAMAIAVAVAVPFGVLAARRPRLGGPVVAFANIVQTIPSLAMFGFLIPVPLVGGIGARAAIVVLILYGLLPIVRMTVAGLRSIDRAVLEAGEAMGMTGRQLFTLVELPLALPAIVSGIRVATVTAVGAATIAAAIGAGGLGEFIFRGLSMVDSTVILAGAIPAAALALAADGLLTWLERSLSRHGRRRHRARAVAVAALALLVVAGSSAAIAARTRSQVVVGSKNFTEQLILGEIVAQALERQGLVVDRRLDLGGTAICDRAVKAGEIDVYVEYTGTALTAIFNRPVTHDRGAALREVRQAYAASGRTLFAPLGFNNTFAILVRGSDARRFGLRSIGDLRRLQDRWRPGFGYEFLERPDGYRGLMKAYDLEFQEPPRVMDLALMYRALAGGQVDVIAGDATSGLIDAFDLVVLQDDRHYFPPYDAAPVANSLSVLHTPAIARALAQLAGRIPDGTMRQLNFDVDVRHRDVAGVAREFWKETESSRPNTRPPFPR